MSERIRPPYRPDDDKPFSWARWGCFYVIALLIGLIALYFASIYFLGPLVAVMIVRVGIVVVILLALTWGLGRRFRK